MQTKPIPAKLFLWSMALLAICTALWFSNPTAATSQISPTGGGTMRYVGPFTNTTLGLTGSVLIDLQVEPTTVSGAINFTDGPDVAGVLCGANNFSGTRSGNNFQFSFASNDPEPGCHITHGVVYNITGVLSGDQIINGTFSVPSIGQNGTYSAKQTLQRTGRFFNDNQSLDGDVLLDLAVHNTSVSGYINFTGDPDDGALCGANSFTGDRNGNAISFSFLSSDPDTGCEIVDDMRFNLNGALSGNNVTNGTYFVPAVGQGGTFWADGPANDTTIPNGNIASPSSGTNIGPGAHIVSAGASDNSGGTGVSYVDFWVRYNGHWYLISTDPTSPYSAHWQSPPGLGSQQVRFAIHVTDKSGNQQQNAGGHVAVNFIESIGGGVEENWVTSDVNAYLNQLSLSPDGNLKCGGSSATMVLAVNNLISRNYPTLSSVANTFGYPSHIYNHIRPGLENRGMSTGGYYCRTADNAWNTIRSEIDAGRPMINLNTQVTNGHYFVVVGYRYQINNGDRKIIVYDPFGKWLGTQNLYDQNFSTPDSRKGYWQTYDFDDTWGYIYGCASGSGYLVTATPTQLQLQSSLLGNGIPSSPPGEISEETEWIVTYEGIGDVTFTEVFLPIVIKP